MMAFSSIYNYTEPLGENQTITMHYDEPKEEIEKKWEALEEDDEEEHREWAEKNYD